MNDLGLYPQTLPTPASLMRTMRQYRWAKRLRPWVFLIIPVPMVLLLVASNYHLLPQVPELLAEWLSLAFGGAVGAAIEGIVRLHRKSLGNLFAQCDLSCTPALFEFLQESLDFENTAENRRERQEFRTQIHAALMRLLPGLRSEHASLFGNRSRSLWRRFLNHPPSNIGDVDLSIVVLKALEILGDNQDLEVAERIADGRSARAWPLKQAAYACVAALRERQKQQQAQSSLLRPADPVAFVGQTLLRAHQDSPVSSLEQLLRASQIPPG
jgi:hypothetical protein